MEIAKISEDIEVANQRKVVDEEDNAELIKRFNFQILTLIILTSYVVVFLSLSRSAILVAVLITLLFSLSTLRQFVFTAIISLGLFSIINQYSIIAIDRLSNFDLKYSYTNTARLSAYTTLIPYLQENPSYILIGNGLTVTKKYPELLKETFGDGRSHAFVSSATYNLGFLFTLLVTFFYYKAFRKATTLNLYYKKLAIALCIIPIGGFLTDHYIIDTPRGWGLFVFLLLLIHKLHNLGNEDSISSEYTLERSYQM